jgi:hypothetical protein
MNSLKKFCFFYAVLNLVHANIWDNLYSNEIRPGEKPKGLKDEYSSWAVTNTYMFHNYNFNVFFSPYASLLHLKLFYVKEEVLELMANFQTNEIFYRPLNTTCQRVLFPNIIKLDLSNINNLSDFLFFKEVDGVFKLDIPYISSKNYLPEITFKSDIDADKTSVKRQVQIKFVTKSLFFESTDNAHEELDAQILLSQFQSCDTLSNLKAFWDSLSVNLFKNFVSNTYNSIRGDFANEPAADN